MDAALKVALDRHGLFVEAVGLDDLRGSVQLTAPDLILLLGDAAEQGGVAALTVLAGDAASAAVPVVLLAPDAGLESRMHAFRHGAMAVVPRSASPDAVARKIAGLSRELSEHFEEKTGEIGEATFDELVDLVKKELRSGILSVHAPNHKGGPMRVVLGAGRPVAQAVQEFVARLKPHVAAADSMYYQFHTSAGGPVELLDMDGAAGDLAALRELRVLLVDDDPARADTLAQELRARGSIVFVTDAQGRGLERAVGLDPQVAIVDAAGLEGPGFEVVRSLRKDLRLRWASILIAPWDEIWPRGAAMPNIERLASRIEPLLSPERDLAERARGDQPFDLRLEAMGPGRMLRILVESGATFHVTVRNPKAVVEVDLAQGLLVGAQARTAQGLDVLGSAGLAALLALGSGRVHVERRANPSVANVMTPVDEALSVASAERSVVPLSSPPEAPHRSLAKPEVRAPLAPKPKPAAPTHATQSADMRWSSGKTGEFVSIADDEEGPQEQTQIKDLAGLAKAGEALLVDHSTETVRPPSPPVDPQEAVRTPQPPPPAVGGPVAANERNNPARPRRSTLAMGAPAIPPNIPPAPPLPSAPLPPEAAPPPPDSAPSIEVEIGPASEEMVAPAHAAAPPSAPVRPPRVVAPLPPPPAMPTVARSEPPVPARGGALRAVALACVVLASLVLAGVLGLIGYRYSGWHRPELDHVLVLLGTEPAAMSADDERPTSPESAVPSPPQDGAALPAGTGDVREPAATVGGQTAEDEAVGDESADEGAGDENAADGDDDTADDDTADDENAGDENAGADDENAGEDDAESANDAAGDEEEAESGSPSEPSSEDEGTDVEDLVRRAQHASNPELSERLYRRVLQLDEHEHHAQVGLARILMDRGENAEAAGLLRDAVQRRPRRAPYRVWLGDALAASGDAAAARREWQRALELEPGNRQAQPRLGQ